MKRYLHLMCILFCTQAAFALTWTKGIYTDSIIPQRSEINPVKVKPISGTWINLVYQDERNKYTNPEKIDSTDPYLWEEKIKELSEIGVEYLVFMAVANEGKSFYPSNLMPWAYPKNRKSPVEAIMSIAEKLNIKVFMSTGWAINQDDDLRKAEIKQRQLDIMKELASIYGHYKSFYGWYLPVEDCICPIFSDNAINSVNDLTDHARSFTPGKKIMISPYGLVNSDFNRSDYEKQLAKLKVDVIAYQDEIGCVRECCPLFRLRDNYKKLRAIHDKLNIELWANCESFTWEKETNSRASALVPAAFPRFLSQMCIASAAGAERNISFIICGLYDKPETKYKLGQSLWSNQAYTDYTNWLNKKGRWKYLEASFLGKLKNDISEGKIEGDVNKQKLFDGQTAVEHYKDKNWSSFNKGCHEFVIKYEKPKHINSVFVRMLNYAPEKISSPSKIYLFGSKDGSDYELLSIQDGCFFQNNLHDAWIDGIWFDNLDVDLKAIKIVINVDDKVYLDEVYINPKIGA